MHLLLRLCWSNNGFLAVSRKVSRAVWCLLRLEWVWGYFFPCSVAKTSLMLMKKGLCSFHNRGDGGYLTDE